LTLLAAHLSQPPGPLNNDYFGHERLFLVSVAQPSRPASYATMRIPFLPIAEAEIVRYDSGLKFVMVPLLLLICFHAMGNQPRRYS
jgi:hypothetical protein